MQYKAYIVDSSYLRGQPNAVLNMYNNALSRFQNRLIAAGFSIQGQIGTPTAYNDLSWYRNAPPMVLPAFFIVSPAGNVVRRLEGSMLTPDSIFSAINSIVPTGSLPTSTPSPILLPNRPIVAPPVNAPMPTQQASSNWWLLLLVAGITYVKFR